MAYIIGSAGQSPERKAAGGKTRTVAVDLPADITLKVSVRDLARIGAVTRPADVTKAAAPVRSAKPAKTKRGRRPVAGKSKKKGIICTGCDRKMKPRDVACGKCGMRRPGGFAETASADKALYVPGDGARPFVVKMAGAGARAALPGEAKKASASRRTAGKSATAAVTKAYSGNVVPIASAKSARTCWNDHPPGKPGAKDCPWCGQPYGLDYAGNAAWHFTKAAKAASAPRTREQLLAEFYANPASDQREGIWRLAHPEIYGQQGGSV